MWDKCDNCGGTLEKPRARGVRSICLKCQKVSNNLSRRVRIAELALRK